MSQLNPITRKSASSRFVVAAIVLIALAAGFTVNANWGTGLGAQFFEAAAASFLSQSAPESLVTEAAPMGGATIKSVCSAGGADFTEIGSATGAVADANTNFPLGNVTYNVCPGHTETLTGKISLVATGSAGNEIIFQKGPGAGANPLITSYVGGSGTPGSASHDGIWKLVGSDYVTIDGIDLAENPANTTNPSTMEYGYALYKAAVNNGAQNNTIRNCTITLNRNNNQASGTSPAVDGSVGIDVQNALDTSATTNVTPTTVDGTNSNNKFYSNTIQNVNIGIALIGFAAASPFTLADTNNDIGGTSAATGNIIKNYGGGLTASNPAAGVRTLAQYGLNVSYNTVNSNDGGGVLHTSTLRGIYLNTAVSASETITNNTVTVKGGGATSAVTAIENVAGATAAGNTVSINNNTITGSTYTTATTGTFTGISNTASAATVNINGNQLTGNSTNATSGTTNLIVNSGAVASALSISSNNINGWTFNSATTGAFNGIAAGTPAPGGTLTINGNNFQAISHAVTGSSVHIYVGWTHGNSVADNINSNTFTNLNVNTTGNATFFNRGTTSMTATGSLSVSNNQIITGYAKGGNATASTVTGYTNGGGATSVAGSTILINQNNFSNVTLTSNTLFVGISENDGPTSADGPTKTISNNTIGFVSGATGNITGITHNFSGPNSAVLNNMISNLTAAGTGQIAGIVSGTSNRGVVQSISGNTISSLSGAALINAIQTSLGPSLTTGNISNNSISGVSTTGTQAVGILESGYGVTTNVFKNTIGNIESSNAAPVAVLGIGSQTAGTTHNITNNRIGDLRAPTANATNSLIGISATFGTANIRYNTVYLNASSTGTNFGSSAFNGGTGASSIELQNNILTNTSTPNGTGLSVAHRRSGVTLTNYAAASNRNDFNAPTIFFDGITAQNTLAGYQAVVAPRDANSISVAPNFLSTVSGNPNFLKINPTLATPLEGGAANIAGITDDFENDVRAGNVGYPGTGSAPDIGADEFEGAPAVNGMQFSAANYPATEGALVVVTVNRLGSTSGSASVNYATSDGSANSGTCGTGDYESASGTLNFADTEASKTFTVQTCNDASTPESPETVNLTLSVPVNTTIIGAGTSTITIADNPPGQIQFSSATYNSDEGTSAVVTVTRTGGTGAAVTADYSITANTATSGGSCGAGVDYTPPANGTFSWAANDGTSRTITIPLCADVLYTEGPETVDLALTNVTGGATVGIDDAVLTINDVGSTFCSSGPITTPAAGGPVASTPYPSTVSVTSLTGATSTVKVRLNSIQHTWAHDLDILLVSPTGEEFVLMSDVGDNSAGTGLDTAVNLIIADGGAIFPLTQFASTTYAPRDVDADTWAAGAPAGPYFSPAPIGTSTLNGVFGGLNPNGTWQLFVSDDTNQDGGSIASWCVEVTTAPVVTTYTVTYDGNLNDGGTAPVDGNSPYSAGSTVTVLGPGSLTRTGYSFTGWNTIADGSGTAYSPAATFTINADTTLYAQWAINQYTLTYDVSPPAGGSILGTTPQIVAHGGSGTSVTAVGNTGYTFVQWSDGNTNPTRTDTNVTASATYTAQFTLNQYTLTYNVSPAAGGSITGTNPQIVSHGGNGTAVTAVPNPGYGFVQWSDGNTNATRTDTNVTANATYTAQFVTVCEQISVADDTTFTGVVKTVPVNTSTLTAADFVLSADMTVTYNAAVLTPAGNAMTNFGVTTGTVANSGGGVLLTVTNPSSGVLTISVFSTNAMVGAGDLVNLNFNVVGLPGTTSNIGLSNFEYNEGTPCSITDDGVISVISGTVSGTVSYGNSIVAPPMGVSTKVPGVTISSTGIGSPPSVTTATNGTYSMSGFTGGGSFTLAPSKSTEPNMGIGVTGNDAACIAQYIVGQPGGCMTSPGYPTATQLTVADVSTNGTITSYDAALIAQFVAAVVGGGSPNTSGTWFFAPVNRSYPTLFVDYPGEDYLGYLMGDVTGNWYDPSANRPQRTIFSDRPTMVTAPTLTAGYGSEVNIPVAIGRTDGREIVSYEFDLAYDPSVLRPHAVAAVLEGTRSEGMTVVANPISAGLLRVVVFGTAPMTGEGTLITLRFTAIGEIGSATDLSWPQFRMNEGGVNFATANGRVEIGPPTNR